MKNKTNKTLIILILVGIFSFFSGCQTDKTQNSSNQNDSNDAESSEKLFGDPKCSQDTDDELKVKIINRIKEKKKYEQLEDQFKAENFTLDVSTADVGANKIRTLTVKGFIKGRKKGYSGYPSQLLLEVINHFRGKECIRRVFFQGKSSGSYFKWIPDSAQPTPRSVEKCATDIDNEIKKSRLGKKHGGRFKFPYDKGNRKLEIDGIVGDKHSSKLFKNLFDEIDEYMDNGCIKEIVFGSSNRNSGFLWTLCEPPACDDMGVCRDPCILPGETNTNSNTNSNSSNSNSP